MELFKRIFGSGNEESDQRIKEETEQVKAGLITKIYPILKPGDWMGVKAGAVKQTLIGTPENPYLVAAFGYDAPSNFVFLMPDDLKGKDPNKILKDAYDNLEEVVSEFVPSDSLNNRVLTASGHDFSSEKILCKSHMMKAHALLKSKTLFVSIPRRRCMMVMAQEDSEKLLSTFIYLHKTAWEEDTYGNAPIVNALFIVVNGEIKSLYSTGDDKPVGQSMDKAFEV